MGERSTFNHRRAAAIIIEGLRQHFGPKFDPLTTILPPPTDPDRLQYELMKIAPTTCGVGCSLMNLISSKAVAIIVPKLHLLTCTVDERKVPLYSLSVIMGYPTATDARDTVAWPIIVRTTNQVNNRAQSANYFVTHSESNAEAEYHTDSTFDAEPERYFFLYVNHAARCGGGLSRVRSNAETIRYLQNSADGRAAAATLRNRLFPSAPRVLSLGPAAPHRRTPSHQS